MGRPYGSPAPAGRRRTRSWKLGDPRHGHGSSRSEENPLLGVLTEKVLPEKEANGPVSGLLYFFLDGKHKPKDLELNYRGAAGKLSLRFKN